MTMVIPDSIKKVFGEHANDPHFRFYQDVGQVRRKISTDVEDDAFFSVEASYHNNTPVGTDLGAMIVAITYDAAGSFKFAHKYGEDGESQKIDEAEGLSILKALYGKDWIKEQIPA